MKLANIVLLIPVCFFCEAHTIQKFDLYHPIESIKIIKDYIPTNPIIFEAGAYDGAETISLMNFWPEGTIYSFEPVPELYQKLVTKTAPYKSIHVYPYAISDTIGIASFHVSSTNDAPSQASQSSSLLEPKEHLVHAPWVTFTTTVTVPTITIDAWAADHNIDHIDLMWLDMQGYELTALKAAPNILKTVKAILTEVEFDEAYKGQSCYKEVKEWMEAQGFQIIAADVDLEKPEHWFGDVLFVRK